MCGFWRRAWTCQGIRSADRMGASVILRQLLDVGCSVLTQDGGQARVITEAQDIFPVVHCHLIDVLVIIIKPLDVTRTQNECNAV